MTTTMGTTTPGRVVKTFGMAPLAIFLFLAISMVSVVAPRAAQAQTYVFNTIEVRGNQRIETSTILSFAGIARGQRISAGELNDSYQRVVDSGLFEKVTYSPQGATLTIAVIEWPTINRISIEGNRRIKDDTLLPLLESQPRKVYSPSVAERDAALIAEAYEAQARFGASVKPKIIRRSDNRVDLIFEVAESRVVEIERISFVGNRRFSDRRLRQVLQTKQAGLLRQFIKKDTFVADRIAFDKQVLTDFYQSRGHVDFKVLSVTPEFSRERNAFFLTFTVQEGQPYSFGDVTVVSEVPGADPDEFRRAVKIRRGQTYNPAAVENSIARMEKLALDKGLDFVRVDPRVTRNDRTLTLDIEFRIVRGPRIFIERIDIEGNVTTLDRVIRRQFDSVEGDPFNPREIREAAARIRFLNFFTKADVEARQGSAPDQVIIDVDVEEAPTGSLTFGVSYSIDAGIGGTITFAERNFLGRGQTLRFTFESTDSSTNYSLSFTEPAFLGRDVAASVSSYYTTRTSDTAIYSSERIGGSVGIEFPVSDNVRVGVNTEVKSVDIFDVSPGSSVLLAADAGEVVSASVGYEVSYDSRRTGLNPNAGVLLRFGQDLVATDVGGGFVKTSALALAQTRVLKEEVTLRAIVEGGAVQTVNGGTARITDRFFLTSNQMRGFRSGGLGPRDLDAANTDSLGGNYFAVARFEADFPLGLPEEYGINGGVFLDAGAVWGLDATAGGPQTGCPAVPVQPGCVVDDGFHLRSAIGFSVFWDTPVGPLRFNFSTPLAAEDYDETRNFDLTVQTKF